MLRDYDDFFPSFSLIINFCFLFYTKNDVDDDDFVTIYNIIYYYIVPVDPTTRNYIIFVYTIIII